MTIKQLNTTNKRQHCNFQFKHFVICVTIYFCKFIIQSLLITRTYFLNYKCLVILKCSYFSRFIATSELFCISFILLHLQGIKFGESSSLERRRVERAKGRLRNLSALKRIDPGGTLKARRGRVITQLDNDSRYARQNH